ncbi:MAG: hypothetical protein OXI38_13875 [Bacteroidota bacterium]|nr:hypothetical protein [Bacteroidota bacterium]
MSILRNISAAITIDLLDTITTSEGLFGGLTQQITLRLRSYATGVS